MSRITYVAVSLLFLSATMNAAIFRFASDPFAGSDAPTTDGRQVVGGEDFISFNVAQDVFSLEPNIFGVGSQVNFANGLVEALPTSGVNVVVLQTTDNDGDPVTPFGAGNAATLIASQIDTSGPGFFIYFNSGLNLPRLVFSTDLSDETSDLKILFRMTNLAGQSNALSTFTESNFSFDPVPEPSSMLLMTAAGAFWACGYAMRRRRTRG